MSATSAMTTREVFKYLAEQQAKGWPGSHSIHPRHWAKKPQARQQRKEAA